MKHCKETIRKLRLGRDEPAYKKAVLDFYQESKPNIMRNLQGYHFRLSSEDALVVFGEAFSYCINNFRKFKTPDEWPDNCHGYLYGIARNKARQLINSRERYKKGPIDPFSEVADTKHTVINPDSELRNVDIETVTTLIKKELDEKCWALLIKNMNGVSYRELAEILGLKSKNAVQVVGVKILRCKKRLKTLVFNNPTLLNIINDLLNNK